MNKWLKRFLISVVLLAILFLLWLPAFTTCSLNGRTAVIAKYPRKRLLTAGDLLLVEVDPPLATNQSIYRLEQIHPPDPSTRQRAALRAGVKGRIARGILDMDFKPTYSVSLLNENITNAPVIIRERQIKGKVIYVLRSN